MSAAAPRSQERWLYGPMRDLILGCGLGYMVIFVVLLLGGREVQGLLPLGLLPIISVFAGTPHYGATLLRVYQNRDERRRYVFFTVWMTILIWALYVGGLYQATLGALLLTVYLTWSPWHYTGQNYGIALMFLRRRGVEVTPRTKRAIHTSFVLSYVLTLLAIHGAEPGADYAPVESYTESAYTFLRLGIPSPWWQLGFGGFGIGYLAATGFAARELLRRARPADLAPSAAIAFTQLLWFSLPPLGRELGLLRGVDSFSPEFATYAFIWIAAGHAVQYLWITSYFSEDTRDGGSQLRWYLKCIFAGSAIWSLPAIVYSWTGLESSALGGVARGPDAGVLLAAIVNLHHFVLDGAIWKLRDGRVARILIRRQKGETSVPAPIDDRPRRAWLGPVLLGAGALWTLSTLVTLVVNEFGVTRPLARGELATAERSLDRLAWLRRDDYRNWIALGRAANDAGDRTTAVTALDRAIERNPRASLYAAKGRLLEQYGDLDGALRAYEAGVERNPEHPLTRQHLGRMLLDRGDAAGALVHLERAHSAAPDDERIALTLKRARRTLATAPE